MALTIESGVLITSGILVSATTDPYFNQTTLLLNDNGTTASNNNTFLDSSTNNFAITRNGNTAQGTFTPFSQTGWSNYFGGNGNYLSPAAGNANYNPGATGAWTFETWVYPVASLYFYGVGGGTSYSNSMACAWNGTTFTFAQGNGSSNPVSITASSNFAANAWYHYVVCKDANNVIRMFINGVQVGTQTYSSAISSGNRPVINGVYDNNGLGSGGGTFYISNLRWVLGGALYTSNFTPSTVPLTTTVSAGTCYLLFAQSNRFSDVTNTSTFVATGTPSVQAFSPFAPTSAYTTSLVGGSAYFDGTGDYLNLSGQAAFAFGTSDFTIEFWYYSTNSGVQQIVYDSRPSGTPTGVYMAVYKQSTNAFAIYVNGTSYCAGATAVPANSWNHIVVTRLGTNTRLFVNGVQDGILTSDTYSYLNGTNRPAIGVDGSGLASYVNGYIFGLRVLKGTGYTSISVPTSPPTAITNTQLLLNFTNSAIYDATGKNYLLPVGNTQVSSAQAKFGSTSLLFNGTTDYLLPSSSTAFALGTGDFTVELWIYPTSMTNTSGCLIDFRASGGGSSQVKPTLQLITGSLSFIVSATTRITTTGFVTNNWYHIALVRASGVTRLYTNGVSNATAYTDTNNYGTTAQDIVIGQVGDSRAFATGYYAGYIDELCLTKYARYAANFTVPNTAFPIQ
jgi:hypothetical protein